MRGARQRPHSTLTVAHPSLLPLRPYMIGGQHTPHMLNAVSFPPAGAWQPHCMPTCDQMTRLHWLKSVLVPGAAAEPSHEIPGTGGLPFLSDLGAYLTTLTVRSATQSCHTPKWLALCTARKYLVCV